MTSPVLRRAGVALALLACASLPAAAPASDFASVRLASIDVARGQSARLILTNAARTGTVGCRAQLGFGGMDDPNEVVAAPGRSAAVNTATVGNVQPTAAVISDPNECEPRLLAELLAADGSVLARFEPSPETRARVASAGSPRGTRYLVSLGDSLAASVQPDAPPPYNESDNGYAEQLLALLRTREPNVELIKLGCGGESLRSLPNGSQLPPLASCGPPDFYTARYPQGTQLATAEQFLRTHRGQIAAVTIDIGANDIGDCVEEGDVTCVQGRLPDMATRLAAVLKALRRAGAPLIVGMIYYNPFLGRWLDGPAGQANAHATNDAILPVNALLTRVYRAAGARVADVADAFHITDFEPHGGALPLNVTLACRWTWFCTAPSLGPDVHANDDGYGVIARAFADQIWRSRS